MSVWESDDRWRWSIIRETNDDINVYCNVYFVLIRSCCSRLFFTMFSSFFPLLSPTYIFQQISMNRFFFIIGCCNNPPSFCALPGLVTTPWSKSLIFLEIFSGFQEILSPPYFYLSPNCIDFGTLEQQRHKRSIPASAKSHFHLLPEGLSAQVKNLFLCLCVCHHFNILKIGPLYHPRIMSDPTYQILLGRGWCQLSSGDVNDTHKDKYTD